VGDCPFHHLRRLQHKRQDQFSGSEAVAYILHGGQEDGIENIDGGLTLFDLHGFSTLCNEGIDQWLNAFFVAMENLPVNAFGGIHTLGGIDLLFARALL